MDSVTAMLVSKEMIALSFPVQTAASTEGAVLTASVCVRKASLVRTVASGPAPQTAMAAASALRDVVCVMQASPVRTAPN